MVESGREKTWKPSRYQSFALFGQKLYFATIGVTPLGLLMETEPVRVLAPTPEVLRAALEEALNRQPPTIPGWRPGEPPPKSPLQAAARCRSWRGFARGSVRFAVLETPAGWQIAVSVGPTAAEAVAAELHSGAAFTEIAAKVLEIAETYREWKA